MKPRLQLASLLILAVCGAAGAQEAPAGVDLRATVTAQTIASNAHDAKIVVVAHANHSNMEKDSRSRWPFSMP